MRDAMGGSVTIIIIVVFIVVALGYLAFNVNYTKAFRMRDKIIAVYEDYDGDCSSTDCKNVIRNYAKSIGYRLGFLNCPEGFKSLDDMYCLKETIVNKNRSDSSISHIKGDSDNKYSDVKVRHYYTVITKINLEIPIISNVFDFGLFYISGDTRTFDVKQ